MLRLRLAILLIALPTPIPALAQTPAAAERPATRNEYSEAMQFHIAGYADVTYVDTRGVGSSLGTVTLAPILHAQFGDRFLLEAELEMEMDDRGEQETALEYAALNWLLTDRQAIVVGKFLSPVGYFFQNLHPSWINKLAAVPVGFGHGGAAPLTDVGVQWRGGATLSDSHQLNYALYYANGPRLGLEGMDDLDLDVEGSMINRDGRRVWGGRVGWLPDPRLELGVSMARGEVILDPGDQSASEEPSRAYRVDGMDVAWRPLPRIDLRGEWIRQQVSGASSSLVPDAATWRAWYLQGGYHFGSDRWESVLRFGDSVSPHGESTFQQMAVGLNYLIQPQTQLKLSWEFNRSDDADAAADRLLLQLAHGF